ncbi:MAG TPA: 23S rRNA (uracil(1939)-C(5))-methyltransferase RlmD [Porphyromonadaceae bacterium]|nr:23S rRNA (uracil(1939)-C(5))-methyltransferase RlmD [Porphyromonadaceae bacterium]
MSGRKNRHLKPLIEGVEILSVGAEGKAVGKVGEMVLFVPFAVPGDIVDVQVTKKRNHYAEGYVVNYQHLSPTRSVPFCSHFGICGGCSWQILPYQEQLRWKEQQVKDNLERIGKISLPPISPILGSAQEREYRNKLEFSFTNRMWLSKELLECEDKGDQRGCGFHVPGMFDKVLDIECCHLMNPIQNRIRLFLKNYGKENNLPFFDLRSQEGLLRGMIIRKSTIGEVMVVAIFAYNEPSVIEPMLNALKEEVKEITSLFFVINPKCNDSIADLHCELFYGKPFIEEKLEDLTFRISPKSFFQTNTHQAEVLYSVVRNFCSLSGKEILYDLYCGTGSIGIFLSKNCKKVVGIEYVPEAIEDAKINASTNGILNTSFFAGDMKELFNTDFIAENGTPDVIVVDPPRAGMHEDVVKCLLENGSPELVYVSCNPATQARDLNLLNEKYELKAIQPVDMFPHTFHVENVAYLERR